MYLTLLTFAIIIISGLAFYAGSLLFKLKQQKDARTTKTKQRIDNITESIQTIAKAMEQQQCNLSEGSIRLFHLLEGLPLAERPDFSQQFPNVYCLYEEVRDFPTHQARKDQAKEVIQQQDIRREEIESKLESKILSEVNVLKTFSV